MDSHSPAPPTAADFITLEASTAAVPDTTQIFAAEVETPRPRPVPGREGEHYIPYGTDNRLPYELITRVAEDEVLSQNKLFNTLTCYGAGLTLQDPATHLPTTDPDIRAWADRQNLPLFLLEQITDLKYFYFTVVVIILNRAGNRINKIRHKESAFVRLGRADDSGRVPCIYSADWTRTHLSRQDVERIPLLDTYDPLGDLRARLGLEPDERGRRRRPTTERKFALLLRFPTPGSAYYPTPHWTAVFRGGSYDEKRLIATGKRAKLRNHTSMRYQVEIQRDYFARICREEFITDPKLQLERIAREKDNIRRFLSGLENSDKVWISGFYVDPSGNEVRDVRINVIDARKEGGEWAEDVQSAANTMCYAESIHPNLVGAVPGKSQSNNSGSDKRELFTMKQALEVAPHDLLLAPLRLVAAFHGWNVEPVVPMIQLTTLDDHRDSKKVDPKAQHSQHPEED